MQTKGESRREAASIELNLANRIDRMPITWFQNKIFLIIATAWLFDSIDLASLTFVLAAISNEFGLTGAQAGLLASSSFAGMVVGASCAGMLADRFGRKVVFQTSMIVWGVASLLLAVGWSWESLLVFRFLLGVGMGAEFPVAQSLVSEFIRSKNRGQYIAWLEGMWPIGFIVAGVMALILVPTVGWRAVFVIQGLLAIWVLIIRRQVPESARWHESRGDYDGAERVMSYVEGKVEERTGSSLPAPAPARHVEGAFTGFSLPQLFTAQFRVRTIMIWLLWFFVLLGFYGITTFISYLLAEAGFTIAQSIGYVVLMALWGIPGFLTGAYLIERLGRKVTVAGFILLSAAAAMVYGQVPSYTDALVPVIAAGSVMQFFFFGMWSVLYAYTPEVFPTRARATGCGTASAVGRVGALLGPAIVPLVLAAYGSGAVYALAAGSFVVAAAVVLVLGPETKQRVLEEVSS